MGPEELAGVLRSVLAKRLTVEEAGRLGAAMRPMAVRASEPICREGEETLGLMVLLAGSAEVLMHGRERLATVEAPTVLGEMGLLTGGRHTETVRALTDCQLRLLPRAEFARLLDGDSLAGYKLVATIAEVLARRLYSMDQKVVELLTRSAPATPVEELVALKRKLFIEWSF